MTDPNRSPIVWCLIGYMAVALVAMNVGLLADVRWAQIVGGFMMGLLLLTALAAALYLFFDRRRTGR